jgi:malonate decarboxylase alpha subunit
MTASSSGRWDTLARNRAVRLERAASLASGRVVSADQIVQLLEAVIEPGDRVCIEGNNQKQADFLARSLIKTDPARVCNLHLVQSVLALPEHST